jgi:Flp pilus assembly protein TadG
VSGARQVLPRIARDRGGASATEFALVLPVLLLLLFGIIDGGRFLWETNRSEKATQMGVRMAVVTNVLAPGLVSENYVGKIVGGMAIKAGDTIPAGALGTVECTSGGCTCKATPCPGSLGTMDSAAFGNVVTRMNAIDPNIVAANVVISYSGSGLGTAGDGGTGMEISPLVTVSLRNANFVPITTLLMATIALPSFSSTLTAEDASGQYSE